jgi:hypothetical protein
LGATETRDDPEIDFRLAEPSAFTRNHDIASHRQLASTSKGETLDFCDSNLSQ